MNTCRMWTRRLPSSSWISNKTLQLVLSVSLAGTRACPSTSGNSSSTRATRERPSSPAWTSTQRTTAVSVNPATTRTVTRSVTQTSSLRTARSGRKGSSSCRSVLRRQPTVKLLGLRADITAIKGQSGARTTLFSGRSLIATSRTLSLALRRSLSKSCSRVSTRISTRSPPSLTWYRIPKTPDTPNISSLEVTRTLVSVPWLATVGGTSPSVGRRGRRSTTLGRRTLACVQFLRS
mmetsp:Transcript_32798/g.88044  ORF Transcript_32798/g.88044 Transcript_32798/m.88044 type:complete len:235 (+) Transcript_32798:482-1186(+)